MMSRLLIAVLCLSAFCTLVHGYSSTNLDCGYTGDDYTDDNSLIWTADYVDLITSSEIIPIPINSVDKPMRNIRVFNANRKKNCYPFDVDQGEKIMFRASFYYGNYDKKSSPPTFDLQFDGNHWVKVVTSLDQVVSHEAVYVTKSTSVSICVAQLFPNQFPFISAIQIQSLDSTMYAQVDSDRALFLGTRLACGSNVTIRYPDDSYDRIWTSATASDGLLDLSSDQTFTDVSALADEAPQEVFPNAFTTSDTSTSISLASNFPPDPTLLHIVMYFAELIDTTELRSFKLRIDNEDIGDPIVPTYEVASETYHTNFTASSLSSFSLVATTNSSLPPLINALEVFTISDVLSDGTYSGDVDGLVELQNQFDPLTLWYGEPCLPATYTWDWLNCSSDLTPRVTSLYLSSFNLSGELPDFSVLTALETIDLSNNSLQGTIPEFLGTLPNLKTLILADNQFSGSIPSSISKNTNLKLDVSGNPDLCVSGKSCKQLDTSTGSDGSQTIRKDNNRRVILAAVIPIFVLVWIVVIIFIVLHQKRKAALVLNYSRQNFHNGGGARQETGGSTEMNENVTNSTDQNQ